MQRIVLSIAGILFVSGGRLKYARGQQGIMRLQEFAYDHSVKRSSC
jgi:hypothetical protein